MTRLDYRHLARNLLNKEANNTQAEDNANSGENATLSNADAKDTAATTTNNSKRKQGNPTGNKPYLYLKYLRFRCYDMERTTEFYHILGMTMDYKATTVLEVREDEEVAKTILGFSFGVFAQTPLKDEDVPRNFSKPDFQPLSDTLKSFQLLFEHHTLIQKYDIVDDTKKGILSLSDRHNYEYLVVYAHFINRIVKRLAARGFEVLINPMDVSQTKLAIVKDPNGIEVRLMELQDIHLGIKKKWYNKLAYYTIPTYGAADTAQNYEKTFTLYGKREVATNNPPSTMRTTTFSPAIIEPKASEHGVNTNKGFKVVDSDDFLIGLSKTAFIWMGNDLRTENFTLCFVQKKELGISKISDGPNLLNGHLLGVGFQTQHISIDGYISKLKGEKGYLHIEDGKVIIPGVGYYQRLYDGSNKLWIEIYTYGTPVSEKAKKDKEQANKETIPISKELTEEDVRRLAGQSEKTIKKWQNRFPSASAIEKKGRHWNEGEESESDQDSVEDNDEDPIKEPAISAVNLEVKMGSEVSMTSSFGTKKKKKQPKETKVSDPEAKPPVELKEQKKFQSTNW